MRIEFIIDIHSGLDQKGRNSSSGKFKGCSRWVARSGRRRSATGNVGV